MPDHTVLDQALHFGQLYGLEVHWATAHIQVAGVISPVAAQVLEAEVVASVDLVVEVLAVAAPGVAGKN